MAHRPHQPDVFAAPPLPPGLRPAQDFVSPTEEAELVARIAQLPLAPMQYQQYTALRRVVSYGGQYDFSRQRLDRAEPLPEWLAPLRARAAAWIGVAPEAFTQALIAEYRPGTPLGWHRDVPDFEGHRRHLAAARGGHAVPALSAGGAEEGGCAAARTGAALHLPAARSGALGVAAQRRCHEGVALFHHLADGVVAGAQGTGEHWIPAFAGMTNARG